MTWQDISAKAKQAVLDAIPEQWRLTPDKLPPDSQLDVTGFPSQCGLLSGLELDITDSFAVDIVQKIASGEWKAEDVTRAFCKRAAIAHQLVNCLTVVFFDEAIEQAKALDEYYAKNGKVKGPLHGLPVSLKDNFSLKGKVSSVGFAAWATEPMGEESTIVGILRDLGAVQYVKTNVPTAMMIAETVNNVYGRTVNPQNRSMTSGGSSGGESALIAMRGSPLGIGTDIGGSLRIPAASTGIYTLKPSFGRFPHFDARSGMAGQEAVGAIHGPMARSLKDAKLWITSVVGASPWLKDPKCMPIPWRDVALKSTLKLAVMWNDGLVMPTPPVRRALRSTVETLRSKGYEIVEWSNEDHAELVDLLARFFTADGGKSIRKIVESADEPWRPEMKAYEEATELGVYDLWQLQKKRTTLAKRYLDRWAACKGLDAILCMLPYGCACREGTS